MILWREKEHKQYEKPINFFINQIYNKMKIKHLLMAAAAMVMAVACNDDPVDPTPQPTPEAHDVWGIAGTHQGDSEDTQWKPENSPAMAYADGYYSLTGVELKAGDEFKFVKDNAWTENRGYNGDKPVRANYYYAVVHNGNNIEIEADGTYDIYLNETADKFYIMAAGVAPAEAADAETIVPEPECAATGSISDVQWVEGMWGGYMVYSITTANAAAASWLIVASEYVDETFTAEYVLSEMGGVALDADWGLNQEDFEMEYSRCNPETEYTIFLAYRDANGVTGMVTKTYTTPKAPIAYEDWEAVSAVADVWTEFDETEILVTGAEFKVKVVLNTANIKPNWQYNMLDAEYPVEEYITSGLLLDLEGEIIARLNTVTLEITSGGWDGDYTSITAMGVDGNGDAVKVTMGYGGVPQGLTFETAAPKDITFVVASATLDHSLTDYPDDNSIWELTLTSTTGDIVGLILETTDDNIGYLVGGEYSCYDGWNLPDATGKVFWSYSWSSIGENKTGYALTGTGIDESWIEIDTRYPEEDATSVNGKLVMTNWMDLSDVVNVLFVCDYFALYSAGEGGEEVTPDYPTLTEALNINWNGDHYFTYGVIDWVGVDEIGVCQLSFGSMSGGGMMGSASLEDCLVLGLYLESSANGIPAGTYEISETPEYGKAVAGEVRDMYEGYAPTPVWGPYMCSCCAYLGAGYQYMDPTTLASLQAGGSFTEYTAEDCYIAPIVSGTVTVEALGYSEEMDSDLYNITVDGADANGTKVTITITNAPGM